MMGNIIAGEYSKLVLLCGNEVMLTAKRDVRKDIGSLEVGLVRRSREDVSKT